MILIYAIAIFILGYICDMAWTSLSYLNDKKTFFKKELEGSLKPYAKKNGVKGILMFAFSQEYIQSFLMVFTTGIIVGWMFHTDIETCLSLGMLFQGIGHELGAATNIINLMSYYFGKNR